MKRNQLLKGEPRTHEPHRLLGEVSTGRTGGPAPPREGIRGAWTRFWFSPADPVGLHVLRVAAGLLFLAWLLPLMGHLDGVFGLDGWFDRQAYRETARLADGAPKPISWSLVYLCQSSFQLHVLFWSSIAVLVLFTLGLWPRLTAVLTYVIVGSFTASPVLDADVDPLLLLLAFYLMVGYAVYGQLHGQLSLAGRLLGPAPGWLRPAWRREQTASVGANVVMRLLGVHFALVMVVNGLHKLQFGDWWSGVAFWYPLHSGPDVTLEQARRFADSAEAYLSVLNVAAYGALLWQVLFPLFAFSPRWRWLVVGGGAVGLLVNAWVYQMPLFGAAVLVGCLGYVTEWRRVGGAIAGRLRRRAAAEQKVVVKSVPVAVGQG